MHTLPARLNKEKETKRLLLAGARGTVVGVDKLLAVALAVGDWSYQAIVELAKSLDSILIRGISYGINPNNLDWTPAQVKLDALRSQLMGRAQPKEWFSIVNKCSVLAVFEDSVTTRPGLARYHDANTQQVMRFLDGASWTSPRPAHVALENQWESTPVSADYVWTGDAYFDPCLWLQMMHGIYQYRRPYQHNSTAGVWEAFKFYMKEHLNDIALDQLGFTRPRRWKVNIYDDDPNDAPKIRPSEAVPRSEGIYFHLEEINTNHDPPRKLDLVMFPGVEPWNDKSATPICKLEWTRSRYSQPLRSWKMEDSEIELNNTPIHVDLILVARNATNWQPDDEPDLFICLGLK